MGEVNERDKNKVKKVGDELGEFISKLREKIAKDKTNRTAWNNKLVIASNQRLGVKRKTNSPYPGAPNVPIQEADKQIRKRKPNFVLSVIGQGKPVNVDFGSSLLEQSQELLVKKWKAELAINHVLMNEIDLLKTITIASDQFLEKGHCIFKVIEEFRSEIIHKTIDVDEFDEMAVKEFKGMPRKSQVEFVSQYFQLDMTDDDELDIINDIIDQFESGKTVIEYDYEKISSMPKILVRDAERIYVPSYATCIRDAERITDEFFLTERELIDRGLSGAYNLKKVKAVIEKSQTTSKDDVTDSDFVDSTKNKNEGIVNEMDSEQYRMHEVETWRPTGKKGKFERWVITMFTDVADVNDATVQVLRYPMEFDSWNYVKHDNELKDERYYSSRGIPEQIRALQQVMEKSINNMLIRDQVNNSPMFTVLTTSKIQPSTIQFVPGQRIQVSRHDEIQELSSRTGKVDLSSINIFQIIKAFLEEYIGSTDQLFRNATNSGGGKTLGEINRGIELSQNLISIELLLWNDSLKKVYDMVWSILKNRSGDPIVVQTGNGPVSVTRDDFNFDARVTPTGTIESLDKARRIEKAFQRVNLIMQQIQLGVIANEEDLYNVMEDFLVEDGVKNPERYITRPQVIQQQRQAQAQAQDKVLAQKEQELMQEENRLRAQGGGQEQPQQ